MDTKTKIFIGVVALLIASIITQKVINDRYKADILNTFEDKLKDEEKQNLKKIDSLSIEYEQQNLELTKRLDFKDAELLARESSLSKSRNYNSYLNQKIKEYEKNLSYRNRNLDDALDVLTEYEYNTYEEPKGED